MCQICGKNGHNALECYHKSNYAYQDALPPPRIPAMSAQGTQGFSQAKDDQLPHGFSAANTG